MRSYARSRWCALIVFVFVLSNTKHVSEVVSVLFSHILSCLILCHYFCLCQSLCISPCISLCVYASLSVCLSVCLFVCLSVCLSVCMSVHLSVCLSVCLSVWLSVCLSVSLSLSLSLIPLLGSVFCLSSYLINVQCLHHVFYLEPKGIKLVHEKVCFYYTFQQNLVYETNADVVNFSSARRSPFICLKVRAYIPCIAGVGSIYMDSFKPIVGTGYENWIIKFQDATLRNWEKKRVVNANSCIAHGRIEPIAFVHCFRDCVLDGTIADVRAKPQSDIVAAFVLAHRPELEAMLAHFSP